MSRTKASFSHLQLLNLKDVSHESFVVTPSTALLINCWNLKDVSNENFGFTPSTVLINCWNLKDVSHESFVFTPSTVDFNSNLCSLIVIVWFLKMIVSFWLQTCSYPLVFFSIWGCLFPPFGCKNVVILLCFSYLGMFVSNIWLQKCSYPLVFLQFGKMR